MATLLKEAAVGTIVKLNVDGVAKEFIIVNQGRPSSDDGYYYNFSAEGTWLLMKDIWQTGTWTSSGNLYNVIDYPDSNIPNLLNTTFFNALDSDIQSYVSEVELPWVENIRGYETYDVLHCYGEDEGLNSKVFLLSPTEMGVSDPELGKACGRCLQYFNVDSSTRQERCIAYYNGKASKYFLRNSSAGADGEITVVDTDGSSDQYHIPTDAAGIRPCFVLYKDEYPSRLKIQDDGTLTIVSNSSPTTVPAPTYPTRFKEGDRLTISWNPSTDADGDTLYYTLYYKRNGASSWSTLASNLTSTSYSYTVPTGTETLQFFLNVSDGNGGTASGYAGAIAKLLSSVIIGKATIGGALKDFTGEGYVNIGGVWKPLCGSYVNIGGTWKQTF